jgi:hypothetical protein
VDWVSSHFPQSHLIYSHSQLLHLSYRLHYFRQLTEIRLDEVELGSERVPAVRGEIDGTFEDVGALGLAVWQSRQSSSVISKS